MFHYTQFFSGLYYIKSKKFENLAWDYENFQKKLLKLVFPIRESGAKRSNLAFLRFLN